MLTRLLRVQPEVSQCCLSSEALPSEPFTYFGNRTLVFLEGAIPPTQRTRFRWGNPTPAPTQQPRCWSL